MTWIQKEFTLSPYPRGFHLITNDILRQIPEIQKIDVGLAHIHIKHTSASLALNENADPSVRVDMESHFNVLVPEDANYFIHTFEGPDDMTSHIKSVLIGANITVSIANGRFNLGTWQGIYLCEHRNRARGRRIVVTLMGE